MKHFLTWSRNVPALPINWLLSCLFRKPIFRAMALSDSYCQIAHPAKLVPPTYIIFRISQNIKNSRIQTPFKSQMKNLLFLPPANYTTPYSYYTRTVNIKGLSNMLRWIICVTALNKIHENIKLGVLELCVFVNTTYQNSESERSQQ